MLWICIEITSNFIECHTSIILADFYCLVYCFINGKNFTFAANILKQCWLFVIWFCCLVLRSLRLSNTGYKGLNKLIFRLFPKDVYKKQDSLWNSKNDFFRFLWISLYFSNLSKNLQKKWYINVTNRLASPKNKKIRSCNWIDKNVTLILNCQYAWFL